MSVNTTPFNRYMEVQVATAPPEKLVLMCLDGIVRFLNRALQALERGDLEGAHTGIVRAEAVIAELRGSLKMEMGDIPRRLARIYEFLHGHLVEANIRKDPEKVREALRVASELRDAWQELCRLSQRPAAGAAVSARGC